MILHRQAGSATPTGASPLLPVLLVPLLAITSVPAQAGEQAVAVFARESSHAGPSYGFRIPALVTAKDGTLLAFCERRVGLHDHAENDVVLRRSSDGGRSWGPIRVIAEAGADSLNDPCAVVLESGRTLLRYKRYPKGVHQRVSKHTVMAEPGYGGAKNVRVFLVHSDDSGKTWSSPREVTRQMRRRSSISVGSPGAGLQLTRGPHAGRILFPNYEGVRVSATKRTFRNSVSYSDDGGTSWSLSAAIDDDSIAPGRGSEAQIAELSDGSILMSARVQGGSAPGRKLARSSDGGETWTGVRLDTTLKTPPCMSSVLRYSWPKGTAPGLLLHSLPHRKSGRSNGTLFASRDEGATWREVSKIEPGPFAYSCLARGPAGGVCCLYETGKGKTFRIVFRSIPDAVLTKAVVTLEGRETPKKTARTRAPNVLLITSEDHSPDISCYGDKNVKTPSLDRLADEGVRFTRAYVPFSVCSPSRASLLTGLYPHQHGQIGLATHKMAMFRKWPNIVSSLKRAGYRTGMIGKLHVNPASAFPLDKHEFRGSNFRNRPMQRFADTAEAFMRERDDKPFFLMVNYPDAHLPFLATQHGLPPDPLTAEDVTTPAYLGVDTPRLRKAAANYYNCLRRLDTGIGMLMKALARSGHARDTIVIWMADHGAPLARGKTTVYEAGLRVPMIVRWPGVVREGRVEERLVSSLDIFPTLLDAVGGDRPGYALPGRSLMPLLRERSPAPWREHVFGVHEGSWSKTYLPQRSVRDARYKLIANLLPDRENQLYAWYYRQKHSPRCPTDEELLAAPARVREGYETWADHPAYELYDLDADPYEFTNLATSPAHSVVKDRLLGVLRDWQQRTADPLANPALLEQLTGELDDLAARHGDGPGYRRKRGFRWRYLEYLKPDPRRWRPEAHGESGGTDSRLVLGAATHRVAGHDDGVPDGVATAADMYQCYREPVVTKTNQGRIVMLCQAGNRHAWPERSGQDLVVTFSDDGGRTWAAPRVAGEHGNQSMQAHGLVYDREIDRLICLYTVFRWDYSKIKKGRGAVRVAPLVKALRAAGEDVNRQFVIYSDDGGESWSAPRDISSMMPEQDVVCHFGASEGRQVSVGKHAGRLLLPGGIVRHGASAQITSKTLIVWRSDDHGKTWRASTKLTPPGNVRGSPCEARVTELPDGTLLYNERTRRSGRCLAKSSDGGATWSPLRPVPELRCTPCNGSMLTVRDAAGQLTKTLLFSVPSEGGRKDGVLYVSKDGGDSWPIRRDVARGFFAYSALVQIDANSVGLFHESNRYRDIRFRSLSIRDLTGGD